MNSDEILRRNVEEIARKFKLSEDFKEYIIKSWSEEDDEYVNIFFELFEGEEKNAKKILDVGAGTGKFIFAGIKRGLEVLGIELDWWKAEYYKLKLREKKYPEKYISHFILGNAENLPIRSESIDYINLDQTIEHIRNYEKAIKEMLRILKKGGYIFIVGPDYSKSFFEPHYRIFWLPILKNNFLSKIYLKIKGIDTETLNLINFISKRKLIDAIKKSGYKTSIIDISQKNREEYKLRRKEKFRIFFGNLIKKFKEYKINLVQIEKIFEGILEKPKIIEILDFILEIRYQIKKIGREENEIRIIVRKD